MIALVAWIYPISERFLWEDYPHAWITIMIGNGTCGILRLVDNRTRMFYSAGCI